MDKAWSYLRFLETEPTARKFLTDCYQHRGFDHPNRLAFQQSNRFLYTWKQARAFYSAAADADLLIRPLLLFYGCVHMLKGVLLTVEPDYPQNSRMLQHGVTTRKLKRTPYQLLEDEVRPQKEGFFAQLAKVLGPTLLNERYLVKELLGSLSALSDAYAGVTGERYWHRVQMAAQADGSVVLALPFRSNGTLGFSPETYRQFLQRMAPLGLTIPIVEWEPSTGRKQFCLSSADLVLLSDHPVFQRDGETVFVWNGPNDTLPLPVWVNHYLLLYVLSMLCRYETEWWGELVLSHAYAETLLVDRFLTHHEHAFPTFIMEQMKKNNTLFPS
ncbi:YaaC family protein [Brevibacillus sp. H7]|uniref:YaaC family protein n=1 Tax=Brevibacillus sp. H7 TaxID=3349138 RepID=UPI0038023BA8